LLDRRVQTPRVVIRGSLVLLVAACASNPPSSGAPLPTCTACGSGALVDGRFFTNAAGPVAANRDGTVLHATGDQLVWLGDGFATTAWTTLDRDILAVALDDAGDAAAAIGTPSETDPMDGFDAAVVGFAADHAEVWRDDLGTVDLASVVAVGSAVIVASIDSDLADRMIGGVPITEPMVALRTSDGSVAWQRDEAQAGIAPDGTVIITGMFSGTLDLGGSATPLTSSATALYVGALDPGTGLGRWAVVVDDDVGSGDAAVDALAIGPSGEIAVSWRAAIDEMPGSLVMLDAGGNLRWTQPIAQPSSALVTDGDHVVAASALFQQDSFSEYAMTGLDWQQAVTASGLDTPAVLALADDRIIASITSGPSSAPPPDSTRIGDVSYAGDGLALFDLAR
jgi:hypothetical protein